jgi:hypothetical protein
VAGQSRPPPLAAGLKGVKGRCLVPPPYIIPNTRDCILSNNLTVVHQENSNSNSNSEERSASYVMPND